jgi:NADH:ubiquinone oxidoreductase subunit F (NADH-binding)
MTAVLTSDSVHSRGVHAARLLSGPLLSSGREDLASHRARLGPRPPGGAWLVDLLERSGLRGRGGAWFPTASKWRAAAGDAGGPTVVVVNASEGEPLSAKDQTLVAARPHLVLDGAELAAETIGAEEIVVYLARPFAPSTDAIRRAVRERARARLTGPPVRIARSPHRYVAGESSAVVRKLNGGPAKPAFSPHHPAGHRVRGRRVLVQNAETLAHAALIARRGDGWFRECGTESSPGTTLMTLTGSVRVPGVYEVDLAGSIGGALALAGGVPRAAGAALLGGYFGSWLAAEGLSEMPLDRAALSAHGASLGCGVLAVLPVDACGIAETSRIMAYLAAESAGQCGPCVFGLRAIAEVMARIAASEAVPTDEQRVRKWAGSLRGRGACNHPDGAVHNLESALETFAAHLRIHLAGHRCPVDGRLALPQPKLRRWRRP